MNRFASVIALFATTCYRPLAQELPVTDPVGKYRYLDTTYYGKACWAWEIITEKRLDINNDSTYFIKHLRPYDCPPIMPDSGIWKVENNRLILLSAVDLNSGLDTPFYARCTFLFVPGGLKQKRQRRDRSEPVLWKKE